MLKLQLIRIIKQQFQIVNFLIFQYYIAAKTKNCMVNIPQYKKVIIIIYLATLMVKTEIININSLPIQYSSIPSKMTSNMSPFKTVQSIKNASTPSQTTNVQQASFSTTTVPDNQSDIDNFNASGQYSNMTLLALINSSGQQSQRKYESNQTQVNKTFQKMAQMQANESKQEPPSLSALSNSIDQDTYAMVGLNNSMMGSNDLQDFQAQLFNLQSMLNGDDPINNLSKTFATEDPIIKKQQTDEINSNQSSISQSDSTVPKHFLQEMKYSINQKFNSFLSSQSKNS